MLVYVDKPSFNICTKWTRDRATQGQAVVRQVKEFRGPNLNLVMAVASEIGIASARDDDRRMFWQLQG